MSGGPPTSAIMRNVCNLWFLWDTAFNPASTEPYALFRHFSSYPLRARAVSLDPANYGSSVTFDAPTIFRGIDLDQGPPSSVAPYVNWISNTQGRRRSGRSYLMGLGGGAYDGDRRNYLTPTAAAALARCFTNWISMCVAFGEPLPVQLETRRGGVALNPCKVWGVDRAAVTSVYAGTQRRRVRRASDTRRLP